MIRLLTSPKLKKWFLVRHPWHQIYFPFPPALIKFKEPAWLKYLTYTLTLIFLGTLMSRPLSQRQLSDCIFWNNLSAQGFPRPAPSLLYFSHSSCPAVGARIRGHWPNWNVTRRLPSWQLPQPNWADLHCTAWRVWSHAATWNVSRTSNDILSVPILVTTR